MGRLILLRILLLCTIFSFQFVDCTASGFIVIDNNKKKKRLDAPPIKHYTLTQKSLDISVDINDTRAITNIEQTFINDFGRKLEGVYYFPIPKESKFEKIFITLNGNEVETEMITGLHVRSIFKDILTTYNDPALLKYVNQDLIEIDIGEIESSATKFLKINIIEELIPIGNRIEYCLPFNIYKDEFLPLQDFKVSAGIQSKADIKSLFCPSFDAEIARTDDHHALMAFSRTDYNLKDDLKLYFTTESGDLSCNILDYKPSIARDGFFQIEIAPAMAIDSLQIVEKDITFVLDCSGSMSGEKMEQAKRALLYCVNNLNEKDNFNLVRFSTDAEHLFKQLKPNNPDNLNRAKSYISTLVARGSTNIDEALDIALKMEKDPTRPYMIVFITDGKPTRGVTQEGALLESVKRKNSNNAKIFTFGIGDDLNTHLLDNITEMTNAYSTYISSDENIELKLSSFYNKVSSPILTDLSISFEGVKTSNSFPNILPDLYQGQALALYGRYLDWGPGKLLLDGKMNNLDQHFEFDLNFDKEEFNYEHIGYLWASRRAGQLIEKLRRQHGDTTSVNELIDISKNYGIITPYTGKFLLDDPKINTENPSCCYESFLADLKHNPVLSQQVEEGYSNLFLKKEGAGSVQSSRDLSKMNNATNYECINAGQNRLKTVDKKGNEIFFSNKIKRVNGRAFYQSNNTWEDVFLLKNVSDFEKIKIIFNSKEYLSLLDKDLAFCDYLSIGKQVKFVHKNQVFEIVE